MTNDVDEAPDGEGDDSNESDDAGHTAILPRRRGLRSQSEGICAVSSAAAAARSGLPIP